jgi:aminopeptidase N
MNMAYRLAIVRPERREEILNKERGRLMTQELKDEFDFVSRVCNPSAEARTQLFNELLKPENRKQEVWVLQTLRLLNSDVYEPQSNSYIQPALKALPSLLETNSIFFPTNWAKALLEGHKSEGAKQEVTSFLNSSSCPDNLKNKAREASWVLMKQIPYVEKSNTTTKKKK